MLIRALVRLLPPLLIGCLLLTAVLMTVLRVMLTDVSRYQPLLTAEISQVLQVPLRIGRLSAGMHYFSPGLVLDDVVLASAADADVAAVSLKRLRISFDPWLFLQTGEPLQAVKVVVQGANAEVVRDQDGEIYLQGLPHGSAMPAWLFQGKQYTLLDSHIGWQDRRNPGEHLLLRDVELVLKNRRLQHEIHVLANMDATHGGKLRVSARLNGNMASPDELDVEFYTEAVDLHGSVLADYVLPDGYRLSSGTGDIRLWGRRRPGGSPRLIAQLAMRQLALSSRDDKALQLDELAATLVWQAAGNGWRLGMPDLSIANDDWRSESHGLYLQYGDAGWSGMFEHLDLRGAGQLAALILPDGHPYSFLSHAHPQGQLDHLVMFAAPDGQHFAINGEFKALGIDAVAALPGLQGLSGRIEGSDTRGWLEFTSQDVQLIAPEMFRNNLPVKRFSGKVDWSRQGGDWRVSSHGLVVDTPDFRTATDFDVQRVGNRPAPYVDVHTTVADFTDVGRLHLYYPAKAMNQDALKWLDQAFVAGRVKEGQMVLQGWLDQFPFDNGQGRFEARCTVDDGELQYNPDWPHARNIHADVHYLGKDLQVQIDSGQGENVTIDRLLLNIHSLPTSDRAELKGSLRSGLQNALLFLQKSPLSAKVTPLLNLVELKGDTQADLDLSIPYHAGMNFGVKVDARFSNAGLLFKPVSLAFSQIEGELNFTDSTISSRQLTGRVLGYPLSASVATDNAAVHVQARGVTSTDELYKQFGFLKTAIARGDFNYQTELTVPHATNQPQVLNITSNLQGLHIDSGSGLGKAAREERPLNVFFEFNGKPHLPVQIAYGANVHGALLVDMVHGQLYSGQIVFGGRKALSQQLSGLSVEIDQPEFVLTQDMFMPGGGDERFPALRELRLDTGNLIWHNENLGPMHLRFQHEDRQWRGEVASAIAKGRIAVPDQRNGNEPIKLNMEHMDVSAIKGLRFNPAEQVMEYQPLIEIDSRQLLWHGTDLGRFKLQTERRDNGVHFKVIRLSGVDRTLEFNADWVKLAQGSSTLFSGVLHTEDFGRFLAELGCGDDFQETRADIAFSGGWSDTPMQFSLERLHGQLQVRLDDGRISSIEPGLGRLLGLIAMEQWVKRISLDFSDIYRQGLAFNKITGDFKIADGLAVTDNLQVDAVVALIHITGEANLLQKSLNENVAVIPKSSDALPIAGTIIGGFAEFVTNALTSDYKEGYFFGSEYKVTGRWGDIMVTPVDEHEGLMNKTLHGLTDFNWLK